MKADAPSSTVKAIVRGRVQGVGFRAFVAREASRLGLCGTVRNLPDGGVEVRATGDPSVLDQLIRLLHQGPRFAAVHVVELDWNVAAPSAVGFEITG